MTFPPAPTTAAESWEAVHGPVAIADIDRLAREAATRHHLHPTRTSDGMHLSTSAHDADPLLRLAWRPHPPSGPDTLTHTIPDGTVLHEEVVDDSPLHTAVHHAAIDLFGSVELPTHHLAGLCRIAGIAEVLHTHRPAAGIPVGETA